MFVVLVTLVSKEKTQRKVTNKYPKNSGENCIEMHLLFLCDDSRGPIECWVGSSEVTCCEVTAFTLRDARDWISRLCL